MTLPEQSLDAALHELKWRTERARHPRTAPLPFLTAEQADVIVAALDHRHRLLAAIADLRQELQDAEIGGDEMLPAERSLLALAEEATRG